MTPIPVPPPIWRSATLRRRKKKHAFPSACGAIWPTSIPHGIAPALSQGNKLTAWRWHQSAHNFQHFDLCLTSWLKKAQTQSPPSGCSFLERLSHFYRWKICSQIAAPVQRDWEQLRGGEDGSDASQELISSLVRLSIYSHVDWRILASIKIN